jgi:hypothetical protein
MPKDEDDSKPPAWVTEGNFSPEYAETLGEFIRRSRIRDNWFQNLARERIEWVMIEGLKLIPGFEEKFRAAVERAEKARDEKK